MKIGIPSLVDEAPTHRPSILPVSRSSRAPGHAAKYWNRDQLAGIDKGIHRSRERGIPCAFKKSGACLVRRQFNYGEIL
jgi:hypothetical protein